MNQIVLSKGTNPTTNTNPLAKMEEYMNQISYHLERNVDQYTQLIPIEITMALLQLQEEIEEKAAKVTPDQARRLAHIALNSFKRPDVDDMKVFAEGIAEAFSQYSYEMGNKILSNLKRKLRFPLAICDIYEEGEAIQKKIEKATQVAKYHDRKREEREAQRQKAKEISPEEREKVGQMFTKLVESMRAKY